MRCHYLSDLHLEAQEFCGSLPGGDILIVAGDLCHARCLDPSCTDKYAVDQRARVLRFIDLAQRRFAQVLLVPGNHEHYDGVFDDTSALLAERLPGVTVLDNAGVEIGGVSFFGTTLWTDFSGGSQACMDHVRRKCGEFFFVKKRTRTADGKAALTKFQPEHALAAFERSWHALLQYLRERACKTTVVVSHHPPSRRGLNPLHAGNGLDAAFASNLDDEVASWTHVPTWIHGHTHIRGTYTIGNTVLRANCRGFVGKDASAQTFTPAAHFDI